MTKFQMIDSEMHTHATGRNSVLRYTHHYTVQYTVQYTIRVQYRVQYTVQYTVEGPDPPGSKTLAQIVRTH